MPPSERSIKTQLPLPMFYKSILEGCTMPIQDRLAPTIQDIAVLHNWMFAEVRLQLGISPREQNLEVEAAINRIQMEPITTLSESDSATVARRELAAEYIHTTRVLETTLKLKRFMFEHNLPEKVFAYQTGTGFPLPAEIEGCKKLDLFLPYGEKILRHVSQPPVSVDSKNDSPGMYFYEITAENGEKATLIALKDRNHAYDLLGTPRPHHALALLPRVLKGIGVKSLLDAFATGYDGVPYENEAPPNVGDFGYIMANMDLTGVLALTHPGIGSQKLLHQFGGPYQAGMARSSSEELVADFQSVFNAQISDMFNYDAPLPKTHYLFEYDCAGVVDFENEPDWAAAREKTNLIRRQPAMIDERVMQLTNGTEIISAHGMSAAWELAAYHQVNPYGLSTIFNRDLPTLAIAGATDLVDPRKGGQSHHISDQEVKNAGERSKAFIAPVVSRYFISLAGK